jgi:hypothetical protein
MLPGWTVVCGGSRGRPGSAALLASPKAAWMVVGRGEWDEFRAGPLSAVEAVAGLGSCLVGFAQGSMDDGKLR